LHTPQGKTLHASSFATGSGHRFDRSAIEQYEAPRADSIGTRRGWSTAVFPPVGLVLGGQHGAESAAASAVPS